MVRTDPLPPRRLCPEIPPELDRLIQSMLAKDPDQRATLDEVQAVVGGMINKEMLDISIPDQSPTLGFGNITGKTCTGMLCVSMDVLVGYIMLSSLISILVTKMAHRND